MIPRALFLFFAALCLCCDSAAGDSPADSLKPRYTLSEIVITATRASAAQASVPGAASLILRRTIDSMPGSLISDVLGGIPALSIRSYGGGGAVETVSIRGMSPEHTLVLIDGERSNSFQNGLTDFGILSSSSVDRVEVVRGGYSSIYGADAIGGVINIITRPTEEKLSASISSSLGSNTYSADELSLGAGTETAGLRGTIRRERGRGDYPFKFSDGQSETELNRSGNDFSLLTSDVRADYRVSSALRTTASFSHIDADRGSPGAVTDPTSGGTARLADRLSTLRGGLEWEAGEDLTLRLNGLTQYSVERYDDPHMLINGSTVHSHYSNHALILTPDARFSLSPALSGVAGLEWARATLLSSDTKDALRIQRSAYISTEHTIGLPWEVPFEAILYPSLRFDSFSDVRGDLSPRLGLNIGLLKDPVLRLRTSYGKSFRAPVFNDLYWIAGGNPDLRPERAYSFDAGLRSEIALAGSLRIDASYFSIDSRDRIVWLPSGGSFWSPRNIASVRSRGVEVEAAWRGFGGALALTVNSTWTNVKKTSADFPGDPTEEKRLIYEPPQAFNATVELHVGDAGLFVRHSWTSYRYTTEINDHFLPAYAVTSLAARYEVPLGALSASIKLEVSNLFNTSYQVIALYPMPLRQLRGTMEVGI